jgi:hypothetical protein
VSGAGSHQGADVHNLRLAIATVELSREGSDSPNKPNNDNDDQDKHNCSHSDVHVDPPL